MILVLYNSDDGGVLEWHQQYPVLLVLSQRWQKCPGWVYLLTNYCYTSYFVRPKAYLLLSIFQVSPYPWEDLLNHLDSLESKEKHLENCSSFSSNS